MDADLQAWLDQGAAQQQIIAPYVQATQAMTVGYELQVIKQGPGGRAQSRQQGTVRTVPGVPTPLTVVSLSAGRDDQCDVQLRLTTPDGNASLHRFDCPRKG